MWEIGGCSRVFVRCFATVSIGFVCPSQAVAQETLRSFQAEYPKPVVELGGRLQEGEIASAFAITKAIREGLDVVSDQVVPLRT